MSGSQHRPLIAERVQRREAFAFTTGEDLEDIKAALEQLSAQIRQEVPNCTEPVFGEIVAGRGTLATRQDVNALKRELTDLVEARFQRLDVKLDQVLATLGKTNH
ncbi:hypothetical protein ABZ897_60645 [Nonomuraea sp. NPDC046802]|uniref:hypothetical protein n=1 Tax=Nonomuraea sp. NPDC046802 TaxID=3154919 RepID=UPI0033EDED9C